MKYDIDNFQVESLISFIQSKLNRYYPENVNPPTVSVKEDDKYICILFNHEKTEDKHIYGYIDRMTGGLSSNQGDPVGYLDQPQTWDHVCNTFNFRSSK